MSEYKRLTWINEEGVVLPINGTKYPLDDDTEECLEYLFELEDKIESGKLIKSPCEEMYRVIPNTQSNDFNNEPTYRVLKYKIIAISIDGKIYLVESAGWQGKQNQHWINAIEFMTKAQAEARLQELKGESV